MRKYPVGMVLGGRYGWVAGTLAYQGVRGTFWSSFAYAGTNNAYNLELNDAHSTVNTTNYNDKRFGFSLRCLARPQQRITLCKNLKEVT